MKTMKTMKTKSICILALLAMIVPMSLPAAIVTVNPDLVQRIISGGGGDSAYFSTYISQYQTQRTLLSTTNATFNAALESELGALGAGQAYQINSAIFTAGVSSDDYTGNTGAFAMKVDWDNTATWNESSTGNNWSAAGLVAGTDYESTAAADAVAATSYSRTWDLTTEVQDWLSGADATNYGLFFAENGAGASNYTEPANVQWTIDAQIVAVPEPSAYAAIAGFLALGWVMLRRRA